MDVAQSVLRSFFGQLRKQRIEVGEDQSLWPLLVTITLKRFAIAASSGSGPAAIRPAFSRSMAIATR